MSAKIATMTPVDVSLHFAAEVWYWRGPAPFYFVSVPDDLCGQIDDVSREVTYGWGMIPATITIGDTTWPTALWPKDGTFVVPLKTWVRKSEGIDEGETIEVDVVVTPVEPR